MDPAQSTRQITAVVGRERDQIAGWHKITVTIPGLGVIEAGRSDDEGVLDAPTFSWLDGATDTVAELLR